MTTPIKKGTEVWYISEWNSRATILVRRLVVTSWGKEQGTAVSHENGKPVRHRLYTNPKQPFNHLGRIIPVSDLPDPEKEAMRRAVIMKAKNIKHYSDLAHHHSNDKSIRDGYFEWIKSECEKVMAEEPTVIYR